MTSSDSDNIEAIIGYLGLAPEDQEVQRITGLTETTIIEVLRGQDIPDVAQRRHIEVVAQLIRLLADSRRAATGSADRDKPAAGWLHAGPVTTSRGPRTPLEVLTDPDLATDALRGLRG